MDAVSQAQKSHCALPLQEEERQWLKDNFYNKLYRRGSTHPRATPGMTFRKAEEIRHAYLDAVDKSVRPTMVELASRFHTTRKVVEDVVNMRTWCPSNPMLASPPPRKKPVPRGQGPRKRRRRNLEPVFACEQARKSEAELFMARINRVKTTIDEPDRVRMSEPDGEFHWVMRDPPQLDMDAEPIAIEFQGVTTTDNGRTSVYPKHPRWLAHRLAYHIFLDTLPPDGANARLIRRCKLKCCCNPCHFDLQRWKPQPHGQRATEDEIEIKS